jgi:16S rRNA (guanine1516-N2)-methyltransferase
MTHKTIAVFTDTPDLKKAAIQLAHTLQLPFTNQAHLYDYILIFKEESIGLLSTQEKSHPFYIDFLSEKLRHRQKNATVRRESIARAMGLKSHTHPIILDATGGLLRDSFILASLGFDVKAIERSPIIYMLAHNAIERARKDTQLSPIMKRLHLLHADAITYLHQLKPSHFPDIIYLDPMFPERKKSALPKKDMVIFKDIIGADQDADSLLEAALACAKERVVVKRPRHAKPIAGISPSFCLEGSSSRFDIYLTKESHV